VESNSNTTVKPHSVARSDSFDRPDSPLFHTTLPLPKDSAIRRHRLSKHKRDAASPSSSDSYPEHDDVDPPENKPSAMKSPVRSRKKSSQKTPQDSPAGARNRHPRSRSSKGKKREDVDTAGVNRVTRYSILLSEISSML